MHSLFALFLFPQRAFENPFAANKIRTLSKNCRVCGHRDANMVFSFYSPCAILLSDSGEGANHHETYSLL
jgi:hypothetical protein